MTRGVEGKLIVIDECRWWTPNPAAT